MSMKIIAVDFDGTLVDHRYPEIGAPVPHAIDVCRELNKNGVKLILNTMRGDIYLEQAVAWCKAVGIELYGANENPDQHLWTSSPKVYAQRYIDDAAVGAPLIQLAAFERPCVDWLAIRPLLVADGFLPR
jgi:FMN phosphatase YigB (HAD superfamily)